MDQRKKKQLNVPENKGLLHNFKFDLEIPFAPLAQPKTLYYQLDPERHTKPKMLNVEVKNMCSLFVSCDLGLAIDDLNMKPHIFNLQEENSEANNTAAQLHPDDLALINEDIVVSDTEEDEEILKHKQEQQLLEQKIKENQLQMMEKQRLQKETEKVKDKEVDFTQNFDQLRIAISHSFTAAKNIKAADIQHPTDNRRKVAKVFDLFPNTQGANLKLGVLTHKQKIESLTQVIDAGKFCTFYKDLSFLDKNQKLFRFFVEKGAGQKPSKSNKMEEEGSNIKVAEEYQFLFEEDPEVIVEEMEEPLGNNQMRLTNKSVFSYTDHSTKLQANDTLLFLAKNGEPQGNVFYQKVEFQYSLDQEKKELAIGGNFRQELGRFVKMDIIDEEQIKMMKAIDNEIVEEEFGKGKGTQQKSSVAKGSQAKNQSSQNKKSVERQEQEDAEDDDMEEEDDEGSFEIDSEESLPQRNNKKKEVTPTKSYNLREGRKTSQNSFNYQLSVEKKVSSQEKKDEDEEEDNLDDIFGDNNDVTKPKEQLNPKPVEQKGNGFVVEEEDDEEEFEFKQDRKAGEGSSEFAQSNQTTKIKEKDTFINDDEDEDEEDEDDDDDDFDHSSDSGFKKKGSKSKEQFRYTGSGNSASKQDKSKDNEAPEEFPL